MNTARFVHQQVLQLKWHLLACLALIMLLPIEETVVSLHDGDGVSYTATALALCFTPLLAALIACANVQGDLDERRDQFWRSKPVGISRFIAGKFVIGLILSMIILACPCILMRIAAALSGERLEGPVSLHFYAIAFVCLLAYSISFFSNVLIRNTAKAWLIGMTIACFALLIPFLLPLKIKDVYGTILWDSAFLQWSLVVILAGSVLSLAGSLLAVKRNWQVRTELRGLLWGGAALIFAVILLFSRQIANIEILDERDVPGTGNSRLVSRDGKTIVRLLDEQKDYEVGALEGRIEFTEVDRRSDAAYEAYQEALALAPKFDYPAGLDKDFGPSVTARLDSQAYRFGFVWCYRWEQYTKKNGDERSRSVYEKLYLRSSRQYRGYHIPEARLDLSEFLSDRDRAFRVAIDSVENRLVILLWKTCLVVDVSDPQAMVVVETQPIKREYQPKPSGRIDLLPLQSIPTDELISLSIRWRQKIYSGVRQFFALPDVYAADYVCVSHKGIALYELDGHNGDQARARLLDNRLYSFWERGVVHDELLVQDGKLYGRWHNRLMVFDVSGTQIRKLGHYEKLYAGYRIHHLDVLEDGDILLLSGLESKQGDSSEETEIFQLLKNPE